jgi:hypothetical protein
MRRSLLLTIVLALSAAAVAVAATSSGSDSASAVREDRPTSFSAAVSGSGAAGSASVAASGSSTARSDPTTWGRATDREYGRRSRQRMARRLARIVLGSSAERLGVERSELRAAVRDIAADQRGKPRPDRSELTKLRDELATDLGREIGRTRGEVLKAARAELTDRLRQGTELGVVTAAGSRLALDCFDEPSSCDVGELRRELRAGRLLG